MWSQLIGWIMKTKAAKIGGSVLGGGGLIALVFGLHQNVNSKIDRVEDRNKEHVQLLLEPVKTEIKHLKKEVKETKDMVRDIHNYLLKTNK